VTDIKTALFRLAFRREGTMWNCYCTSPENMDGAVLLGSIAMSMIVEHPSHKDAFIALMKAAFADFVKTIKGGVIVKSWAEPTPPPTNEGGHA
jgi:hypothetical protein